MQNSHTKNTGRASGTHISIHVRSLAPLWLIASLFATNVSAQDDTVDFKYLEVKVVDPEGKPMSGVDVEVSIDWAAFPMPTDDDGMIGLNVPSPGAELMLSVQHEGFEVIGARWKKDEEIPDEFTIQLKKGATIGGIVHDEDGNPVEGVSVQGTIYHDNSYPGEKGAGQLRPILKGEIAVTDEKGRWQTLSAPQNLVNSRFRLTLEFSHPDYVAGTRFSVDKDVYEPLQAFENITVLKFGVDLRGRVLDPEDNPVAGAKLLLGRHRYVDKPLEAETDENGAYHIAKAPPGSEVLTIVSPDWAPELINIELERGMKPLDVQLKPGNRVRIRVVDPDGEPIEGVSVYPKEWRGHETLDDPSVRRKTDADGIWQWDHAPDDEIRYTLGKKGYQSTKEEDQTKFVPRAEPYEITMLPAVIVTGKVVDKETGQPIKRFTLIEGVWWRPDYGHYTLQDSNKDVSVNGAYRHVMSHGCEKFILRVEAEGYVPSLSRPIFPDEGVLEIDFELEAGTGPHGVVKLPTGSPVRGVEVFMATSDRMVFFSNGRISRQAVQNVSTTTDSSGRFSFSIAEPEYALVCVHDQGWAEIESRQLVDNSAEMVLQPWSKVSCQVKLGEEPLAGEQVGLSILNSSAPKPLKLSWYYRGKTDEKGICTIDRVRAGTVFASRTIGYADFGSGPRASAGTHSTSAEIAVGKTAQVVVGGEGRFLKGQLAMPDDFDGEVSWNMGIVRFEEQTDADGDAPQVYSPFDRRYAAAISPDGSYEVHDVLPGAYKMTVTLYPKTLPTMGAWKAIGTLERSVTVPESDGGDDAEVVELGKLVLDIPDQKVQE